MLKRLFTLAGILLLTGCGKETFDFGKEDPEAEIARCTRLSEKKHYEKAVECLEIFKSRFPQTPQGQEAELRIADNYYHQGQYLLAADTYLAFVQLFPTHPQIDYALFRAGLSYFRESPKAIDRDQEYLLKAVEQFETALRVTPKGTYREAILKNLHIAMERLARQVYYIGNFYYRTGEYIAAIPRFQELVGKYPESSLVPKSLFRLTKAHLTLGQKEQARQAVEKLLQMFPKNPWTKKAERHYLGEVKS